MGEGDTALAYASGEVPVLATPRLLALAEQACVAAVADTLDSGMTSVGTSVELRHRAPSRVGDEVIARAELTGVEGTRLQFTVTVTSGETQVASATHRRAVVERAAFS